MKKILVNYNFKPDPEFLGEDYLVYDRSDSREWTEHLDPNRVIYTENVGNADYAKLCYLADNYDDLPDVFLWGKTNLFKYVTEEEYDLVKDNVTFTPLLTQNHRTYSDALGTVCYYAGGMYHERNDSWYFSQFSSKYVSDFHEWARAMMLPDPSYLPFAPGGNYILTRDTVHKFSPDYYRKMADALPYQQLPAEAQCAERSYYMMWSNMVR